MSQIDTAESPAHLSITQHSSSSSSLVGKSNLEGLQWGKAMGPFSDYRYQGTGKSIYRLVLPAERIRGSTTGLLDVLDPGCILPELFGLAGLPEIYKVTPERFEEMQRSALEGQQIKDHLDSFGNLDFIMEKCDLDVVGKVEEAQKDTSRGNAYASYNRSYTPNSLDQITNTTVRITSDGSIKLGFINPDIKRIYKSDFTRPGGRRVVDTKIFCQDRSFHYEWKNQDPAAPIEWSLINILYNEVFETDDEGIKYSGQKGQGIALELARGKPDSKRPAFEWRIRGDRTTIYVFQYQAQENQIIIDLIGDNY